MYISSSSSSIHPVSAKCLIGHNLVHLESGKSTGVLEKFWKLKINSMNPVEKVGLCLKYTVFVFLDLQAKNLFKDYQPGVMKNGGKLVVLMEIIEESLKLGEKILIFR